MLASRNLAAGHDNGPVFTDVTFTVNEGDRVGVVGPNGTGKSTLLQVLHGDIDPSEGSVLSDGVIGYLEQVPTADETVTSYVDRMSGGLLSTQAELESLYPRMGSDPKVDDRVGELHTRLEQRNGWDFQSRIDEVFTRLGVPNDAMDKTFGEFSGGQQSRILLAGQLIAEPDVLLLDEPTNNLDTEALAWLEKYLATYKGAVIAVSHDRMFLDNTVSRIIELQGDGESPDYYEGGYTDYRDEKARRFARALRDYEAQSKKEQQLVEAAKSRREMSLKHEGASGSAFYGSKAAKVMRGAIAMENRLARMRRSEGWMDGRPEERQGIPLKLRGESEKGRRLIAATSLKLGYGIDAPTIIEDATFTVNGKDRVAIVGNNGAGKTTLIRSIAGEEELVQDGTVETFTDFSYFAQTKLHEEAKKSKDNMIEWFRGLVGPIYEDEAAALLVWFGFDKQQIWRQKVSNMSPGELNKLSLLAMTYSGKELLLLDEPTNHLDFDALDVVENSLSEYKGTIVTVSHDRQFLGNIACNRLITVADRRVAARDL